MGIEYKSKVTYSRFLSISFCIGILAYLISIIWFNFNGSSFYIFDVYSDALVAKYMADERTLFPSNWVFGNQYYVAATPVVAAFVYSICHDMVLSMGIASCIMTAMIIFSFVWCCKPFVKRDSIIVGIFCLIGAVILGNGICTYKEGMQFLYTLASFYACYVIGFLFTVGAYYRLKNGLQLSPFAYAAIIMLNVALGMQSPRQILILNIPLFGTEVLSVFLYYLKNKRFYISKKALLFVVISFAAELFGLWLVTLFEINTEHLISDLSIVRSFPEFLLKIRIALGNLQAISGLIFLRYGFKWIPLGLIGLFIILVMLIALLRIILKKDLSVSAQFFLIALLSVACVFFVGITVFVSESRYFFMRHVLASFAFMYLWETLPESWWKKLGFSALLVCGFLNLFYNVYPDYKKTDSLEQFYEDIGTQLLEQGKDCVLVDWLSHPTVAACSDDEIDCVTFYPDFDNFRDTGAIIETVVYLRPIDIIENIDPAKTVFLVNDYPDIYMPSFIDQLNDSAPDDYMEIFNEKLTHVKTFEHELLNVLVYTFDDTSIIK